MIVLGLDPSLSMTGYAVLRVTYKNKISLIKGGTIPTSRNTKDPITVDYAKRVAYIARALKELLNYYEPAFVAAEIPMGSKSARASKALALAHGCVVATLELSKVQYQLLNPFEIKKRLCGDPRADKDAIIAFVEGQIPTVTTACKKLARLEVEAICDACAVFLATQC